MTEPTERSLAGRSPLEQWLDRAGTPEADKPRVVELLGPDGKPVRSWPFMAAFPVKWQGPALNAGSANAATETLEIAHEGLELEGDR